jgi:hypothetical protein
MADALDLAMSFTRKPWAGSLWPVGTIKAVSTRLEAMKWRINHD